MLLMILWCFRLSGMKFFVSKVIWRLSLRCCVVKYKMRLMCLSMKLISVMRIFNDFKMNLMIV